MNATTSFFLTQNYRHSKYDYEIIIHFKIWKPSNYTIKLAECCEKFLNFKQEILTKSLFRNNG